MRKLTIFRRYCLVLCLFLHLLWMSLGSLIFFGLCISLDMYFFLPVSYPSVLESISISVKPTSHIKSATIHSYLRQYQETALYLSSLEESNIYSVIKQEHSPIMIWSSRNSHWTKQFIQSMSLINLKKERLGR